MAGFEYKVVPAPTKGLKAKGVKSAEDRFAHTLETLMNSLGAEGWEYQRADTPPAQERAGLTGSQTVWRHVLVFRRAAVAAQEGATDAAVPEPLKLEDKTKAAEAAKAPDPAPDAQSDPEADPKADPRATDAEPETPIPQAETAQSEDATDPDAERPAGQPGATRMLRDNGVEETSDVSGPSASLSALAKNRKSPFGSGV